jgi:hypothetical protein
MSFLLISPEAVESAARSAATIGAAVNTAQSAAAVSTTSVTAAADDEVSAAIAALFSRHAQQFQALGARAVGFHEQFVAALQTAGGTYAAAEAVNVNPLSSLEHAASGGIQWFSPVKDLTGRPLFGNGADGATGTGRAGGAGGWLIGNGGDGGSGVAGTSTSPSGGNGGGRWGGGLVVGAWR